MYIKKSKSNGKEFLSIVHGYRDSNGKTKQKTIKSLGYTEDLSKDFEDPIAHFKNIAKQMTQSQLEEKKIEFAITTNEKLLSNTNNRKNLGYAVIKKIYNDLDLISFFKSKQRNLDVEYNLNSIFSLLTFNRILTPSSKKNSFENKNNFFESFNFSLADVYRSLDYFNLYSSEIQKHLNDVVTKIIGRNNELGYYDVTNYYFEIPYNDEDTFDENGKLIEKGFRKNGPSKEKRHDPIVQMGLLMDSNGIPMAFNTFEGNESEKLSLLPTVKRVKKDYDLKRIIVVADRGLNTSDNTTFLSHKNDDDTIKDGYVFGQSVLGADKEFKNWVLDKSEYITDTEISKDGENIKFIHKSRLFAKQVTLKSNKASARNLKYNIYQKQLVYYSSKYAAKQKKERDLILLKAKDLISNPGKYNKATSFGAASYINDIKFVKSTGEISDTCNLSLKLDKIKEEEKYDGYYSIVTSEKNLSDIEIRNIYKGLWEIEESFKIIKSEFKARPVFVKSKAHINAHFLICFVSLVIFRVLELKLNKKFSAKQIRNSLNNYSCSQAHANFYLFDYRDDVLEYIEKIFNIDFSNKYLSKKNIKKILQIK